MDKEEKTKNKKKKHNLLLTITTDEEINENGLLDIVDSIQYEIGYEEVELSYLGKRIIDDADVKGK